MGALIGNYLIGLAFVAMSQKGEVFGLLSEARRLDMHVDCMLSSVTFLRKVVLFWTCNMSFDYVFYN